MEEKIAILMDSGCDLSDELIEQYNIKVLRLKVLYGETIYSDGLDIDPISVYKRFPEEIPTTSTPNMQEVLDAVDSIREEGYNKIIAITISSGLSGTYNTLAMTFKEIVDIDAYAVDTKNISCGAGLFAIWTARAIESGMKYSEIIRGIEKKLYDSKVFFYMDTLDYLRKGGRISPAVAIVGKILGLKPVISCNEEGTYYTVAKIRGAGKGLNKLISEAMEFAGDDKCIIAVMNGDAPDVSAQVREIIEKSKPNAEIIEEKQITATMAVHTGPGLIGIGVMRI